MKENSQRELWVDVVKGMAILCVVLQHSLQRTMYYFDMSDNFLLNILNTFVNSVNMQWFFVVSGYVYFLRRDKYLSDTKFFMKTRFIDLMIPYLIFGPAIWLGKFVLSAYVHKPVAVEDLVEMFYRPVAFMWFIYVLFFLEIIVFLIDKYVHLSYEKILGILFAVYIYFHVSVGGKGSDILHLVPYFLFWYYVGGVLVYFKQDIENHEAKLCVAGGVIWAAAFGLAQVFKIHAFGFTRILFTVGSVIFVILFVKLKTGDGYLTKILNYYGRKTMYLYILNPICINGIRVVLVKFGVTNMYVNLFLFFFGTVFLAGVVAEIGGRVPAVEFLFSPRKYLIKSK